MRRGLRQRPSARRCSLAAGSGSVSWSPRTGSNPIPQLYIPNCKQTNCRAANAGPWAVRCLACGAVADGTDLFSRAEEGCGFTRLSETVEILFRVFRFFVDTARSGRRSPLPFFCPQNPSVLSQSLSWSVCAQNNSVVYW